jgi:hypothetical protein
MCKVEKDQWQLLNDSLTCATMSQGPLRLQQQWILAKHQHRRPAVWQLRK